LWNLGFGRWGKNPLFGGIPTTRVVKLPGELLKLGSAILKSETVLNLDGTTDCTHYIPATVGNDGSKANETFGTFLVGYNTECARGGRQELHIIRVCNKELGNLHKIGPKSFRLTQQLMARSTVSLLVE
jgi:hypothetical protein